MKFSAVILAGGKSSRMRRDKALLEVDRHPLLTRQIRLARESGADEVFISGRAGSDYSAFGVHVLMDNFQNAGPLAGIESALGKSPSPLLLVLAVDMPDMNADLLRRLVTYCTRIAGAIPRVNGTIEPLAAFYPKNAAWIAAALLAAETGARSAKHFAERCVAAGLATFVDLPAQDAQFFTNWNSPADVPCLK
jgi:molybdopterin-guanine dinucleotide biosynthesis protein A